jgi:6-phosphogluconolactonase (cycloisomerase 2 family)
VSSDAAVEFRSERLSRVFDFNRSHRQLIVRSDPDSRIEIYFGNVSYMALRPVYNGIVVRRPTVEKRTSVGE